MSKYDDFLNNLKQETDNMQVPDLKREIKLKYEPKPKKRRISPMFWKFSYAFCALVLIIGIFSLRLNKNETTKPTDNYTPNIPTTVNDTYAFEIMTATNIIFTSNESTMVNIAMLNTSSSYQADLNSVAQKLHKQYLSIHQILYNDRSSYEVRTSTKEGYTDEMIIKIQYSNFDLQCSLYFNKTLKEIDEEEEVYDLDGIMIISGQTYQVIGETEIENDELETKIKVMIDQNNYFIIEQEQETGEQEFLYTAFKDGRKVQENSLSIEKEGNETQIVIEEKGESKEKITIEIENNQIEAKVEYQDYNGMVIIKDVNNVVNYYFVSEKETISIELIKKIYNFTNKNDNLFVY